MKSYSSFIEIDTGEGIALHDLMSGINDIVTKSNIKNGFVTVTSQHTTTAISINEHEERLVEDVKKFLNQLIPSDSRYLHNDIDQRDCPPDEPENAHSHLAAMLLGSSEVVSLSNNELVLGQYQSIMLYELDGPRTRKVNVQVIGE